MNAFYLTLLLASCTDGSPLDADTNPAADTDVGTASFDIVLPMAGATVTVDEEVVPCDASNVCTVTEAGDGTFEVIVTHPTYYFIPKEVTVEGGVPSASEVTYATGGCASDPNYAGTDWCDDWVMSEYQVAVNGEYCDEQDRCYDTETGHADLDGNGVEEAMLDPWGFGPDGQPTYNMNGFVLYGFWENGETGYGSVSNDLIVITFFYNTGDAELAQKNFTRVSD